MCARAKAHEGNVHVELAAFRPSYDFTRLCELDAPLPTNWPSVASSGRGAIYVSHLVRGRLHIDPKVRVRCTPETVQV